MGDNVVAVESVGKRYRRGSETVHALTDVTVAFHGGELTAITAPSGSGKSTLLHMIGALDRPSEGTVWFTGRDVTALTDDAQSEFRRRSIGFIFQFFNLLPALSAWENVAVPKLLDGESFRQAQRRARDILDLVGLQGRHNHRPAELSGGQIQRVAIARALIMEPQLIIADEPTGNLDSKSGRDIKAILREIASDAGRSVIVATHDADFAAECDRQVQLLDGRIVGDVRQVASAR